MFSYRSLLKRALRVAWRNKYLWFFGLFASITIFGGSLEYRLITQNLNQNLVNGTYNSLNSLIAWQELCRGLANGLNTFFHQNFLVMLNVLTLVLIILAFLVFFIWLALCSQGALVSGVKKIISTKKLTTDTTIREGLSTGHKHLWSLLGLNILVKILITFIFFLLSLPLLFMVLSNAYALVIIYVVLFVIFLPLAVSVSLLFKYAIAYNVLDEKRAVMATGMGWKLFKKNWLVSVEMALILFILNFLAGLAALIILSLLIFPLFLLGAIFGLSWLIILMLLIAIILVVFVGAFMTSFQTATWTDLFLELKANRGRAKLERLFSRRARA